MKIVEALLALPRISWATWQCSVVESSASALLQHIIRSRLIDRL